ncbi:TPA: YhcH/YjgK/YiaL family protein [Vibrio vulnificus]|uniref:YhcH/YjgK/YiaL family protein n=1 Tax=Vibrio sp. 05-20-BW147 TaxID=2575834 RepID=UPI001594ACE3|nr:DUF386 domain-containing protein [Vibrio sp. 05-20-BW147]HAS6348321.1 YhcH/YjgK/YiaL family protein [Vibrio vulnificus]
MFVGKTTELTFASCLSSNLKQIIAQVLAKLAEPIADGRHELDGDNAFFLVMSDHTQPLALRKSECHQRYLDVQILLSGKETFGYSLQPFASIEEDHLAERDLAFSRQVIDERFVTLSANEFIVFYPGQPHRPLIAVEGDGEKVRKAVIKVDMSQY